MAHELGKKWRSRFGPDINTLIDDLLGNFDLTNMSAGGDVSGCKRDPDTRDAISGVTDQLNIPEAPDARYLVRIDQETPVEIHYRGIAIWNPKKNEITKIVGVVRAPALPHSKADLEAASKRKGKAAVPLAAGQEEGTWVATQP